LTFGGRNLVDAVHVRLPLFAWRLVFGAWCLALGNGSKNLKYFHISHLFSGKDLSQFGPLVEESSPLTLLKLSLSDCLELCLEQSQ